MVEPTAADDGVYIPGDGGYGVEAVGTSAFQDTLEFLARGRTEQPTDYVCTAVLLPEPDNPDDPEAIAVTILGEMVGYLPADAAEQMQVAIGQWGFVQATCQALIGGGWYRNKDDKGDFSVWLDVNPDFVPGPFPVAEEAESAPEADETEPEEENDEPAEFLAPVVVPVAAPAERFTISLREVSIAAAAAVVIGVMFSIAWLRVPSASTTDNPNASSAAIRESPATETTISSEQRFRGQMASIAKTPTLEPPPTAIYATTARGPVIGALAPDLTLPAPLASIEKAETPSAAVPFAVAVVRAEAPQISKAIASREFAAVRASIAVVSAPSKAKSLRDQSVIVADVTRSPIEVVPMTNAGRPPVPVLGAEANPIRAISSVQPDSNAAVSVSSTVDPVAGQELSPKPANQVAVGEKMATPDVGSSSAAQPSPGPLLLPGPAGPRRSAPVFTALPPRPSVRLHSHQRIHTLHFLHPRSRHWRPAPDNRWRHSIVLPEYEQKYAAPVVNRPLERPLRPGETMASRLVEDGFREWLDKGLPKALGQPVPIR